MATPLKLYNTHTRSVAPFEPINPPHVSMYVCGVTVYDYCHVGHARAYVVFDLLKRVLTHAGYTVNHVQNFTDIDDKIIDRAHQNKEPYDALTQRFIDAYYEDMNALNILPANQYPKATEHIPDMIALIETLIATNAAYVRDHHVYFRVSACDTYGELSKKDPNDLQSGARVAIQEQKESPLDFVLWKPAKEGEPSWKSPWGHGRPGWHTECVAMVNALMGPSIDIHGGGADLQFPHHENELAQAKCAYHTDFARLWVHNGFVTIQDEKMSKSLGNVFGVRDILNEYSPNVLRFFLLKTHYRAPLNFSSDTLNDAKNAYERLASVFNIVDTPTVPESLAVECQQITDRFWQALYNDLNTSDAVSQLFDMHRFIHKHQCGTNALRDLAQAIGIVFDSPTTIPADIVTMAKNRWEAKQNRDFQTADEWRATIESRGYIIDDAANDYRIRPK